VEREVLKAILFNMKVDHPYQELIRTVKQMKGQRDLAQVRLDGDGFWLARHPPGEQLLTDALFRWRGI